MLRKDLFKTLFSRMLTTYLTVTLCLLLLMGVMVASMFRNQYINKEEQALRNETMRINTIITERYIDENKRPGAVEELKTIARTYDSIIQVIDSTKGGLVSFYDELNSEDKWGKAEDAAKLFWEEDPKRISLPGLDVYPIERLVQPTNASSRKLFSSGSPTLITENGVYYTNLSADVLDIPTLTYARAYVNSSGEAQGIILMQLDMSSVNTSIRQVYLDVLLIGLLAVLVAVLVVYYLTTYITKPIIDMNTIVRKYSKGSFELRLDDSGADEVAQLAKSFNLMAVELSALEVTRRSLVANVSHELRSPLASIGGFIEAMQDGTIPPEKHAEYMQIVIMETKRMTAMVNNLLDLARMESGENALLLTQFDINELVRRTIITFEARINAKHLDVELELIEPNCFVEADVDQIAQVLRNLIDNAIKYSPDKSRLIVKTALKDRRTAIISVQDFGSGIPADDVAHVFQRFYKAEKAHTPSAQAGTGLGLSIAQTIVDLHGQDIWVQSELGTGSTFFFTLKHVQQELRRKIEQRTDLKSKDAGG
ncbi:HAMP domain-containing protein [Eubacteriales bacterium OttesenSCG-928-K08]|nr:HAMP domain-containing protein [Eubacteriales bacterium OttesenSCG-928-K08]